MRFSKAFHVAAISLLGLSGGCAPPPPRGPADPARRVGAFRFWERVSDTSPGVTLEGELVVERDTILVEVTHGLCHYDPFQSRGMAVVYNCAGVVLRFDRDNPIDRATYSLVTTAHVPVRTCVRYVTNADGRRVCAQTRTVMEPREVRRSGRLRPQRVQ